MPRLCFTALRSWKGDRPSGLGQAGTSPPTPRAAERVTMKPGGFHLPKCRWRAAPVVVAGIGCPTNDRRRPASRRSDHIRSAPYCLRFSIDLRRPSHCWTSPIWLTSWTGLQVFVRHRRRSTRPEYCLIGFRKWLDPAVDPPPLRTGWCQRSRLFDFGWRPAGAPIPCFSTCRRSNSDARRVCSLNDLAVLLQDGT